MDSGWPTRLVPLKVRLSLDAACRWFPELCFPARIAPTGLRQPLPLLDDMEQSVPGGRRRVPSCAKRGSLEAVAGGRVARHGLPAEVADRESAKAQRDGKGFATEEEMLSARIPSTHGPIPPVFRGERHCRHGRGRRRSGRGIGGCHRACRAVRAGARPRRPRRGVFLLASRARFPLPSSFRLPRVSTLTISRPTRSRVSSRKT